MIRYCLTKSVVNGSSSGSWQPEARSYFSEEEGLWPQAAGYRPMLVMIRYCLTKNVVNGSSSGNW